jgi:ABC-type multidrug transport system ATPase subunit
LLAAVRSRADAGAAVLYTTHYLPELHELEATVALVVAGRLVDRGSRRELLAELPGRLRLVLRESPSAATLSALQAAVDTAVDVDEREVVIAAVEPGRLLVRLLPLVATELIEVEVQEASLDDLSRAVQRGLVHV